MVVLSLANQMPRHFFQLGYGRSVLATFRFHYSVVIITHCIHDIVKQTGGHVVWGVGLRPLVCLECGLQSRRGTMLCFGQVEASARGRSLVQRSPTECVSMSVIGCNSNPLRLQ